ncbi:unnamed protein product, partial [Sphacelaria rigidula]
RYQRGHLGILADLEEGLKAAPGLRMGGNYITGVAFGDCVQYGYEEAERIEELLKSGVLDQGVKMGAEREAVAA